MNNKYEETANAIRQAEAALKTLKEFTGTQYKAKGETMLEQIIDYVSNTLSNANYIFCGNKIGHLALSNMSNRFVFYIYTDRGCCCGYPIFTVYTDGHVFVSRKLEEWMMLILVREWDDFKNDVGRMIKYTMEERTKKINAELSHIGYVNDQLSKWKV
jgi:hypothetical protein